MATKLKFSLDHDHIFMVGGQDAVHVWKLDEETRKAKNSIIPLGKIKRTISDMEVIMIMIFLINIPNKNFLKYTIKQLCTYYVMYYHVYMNYNYDYNYISIMFKIYNCTIE